MRSRHRHLFKVRVTKAVSHNDRQLEFFQQLELLKLAIDLLKTKEDVESWSCEHWATHILTMLDAHSVEVSEDGENGALVVS